MRLALFDLDHTLLPIDSDYSWGQFTTERGLTDATVFAQRNARFLEDYRAGTLDVHAYVRFATEVIVRLGASKSIALHQDYMRGVIEKNITPQALELVRAHQRVGDTVVIVTATNEFVTRPIAQAFGVEALIAVELERTPDTAQQPGWFTGAIRGTPSFREGKVERVQQWLNARGLEWRDVHTTFYSDSINDLPLLEKAQVAVATNPDERLRSVALARGWRILDLFFAPTDTATQPT